MCYTKGGIMPPIAKFSKEDIINCGYELIKKEGMDSLNARRIARELKASVQPIFHNFKNMEELKLCIYDKIYQTYLSYMNSNKDKDNPYKQMGLSYIRFAKDYPEFFKIIFMQSTKLNAEEFILSDNVGDDVIKVGQRLTGLSKEDQKKFHVKVWIFTHGIASLVATNTIKISNEEIEKLLESSVREMLIGYKKENR